MQIVRHQVCLLAIAWLVCAPHAALGTNLPVLDPSCQHLCLPNAVRMTPKPGKPCPCGHDVCVSIMPGTVVAPIGAEVVMVAGVCGNDGYLYGDERVEWIVDPAGEGYIVDVGDGSAFDLFQLWRNRPHKVDNTFAIGRTQIKGVTLTRGTPAPEDDVPVLPGQGWITVTSSREGTSDVTAFAPSVHGWDGRTQRARIHWVDATWSFPPPATNPLGTRHVLTTTVVHQSDHTPIVGYRVRYEVQGGPAAGFAPDGAPTLEVPTDDLGQASVELFQLEPAPGTNQIGIQIIRPADLPGGDGRRMVMAAGATHKTWISSDISINVTGPTQAAVGGNSTYRIEVYNPATSAVNDVVVTDELPPGMTFVGSQPQATPTAGRLEWRFASLGPRQTQSIEVTLRADQPGMVQHCATVATGAGVSARDCATTTVLDSPLEVRMTGPTQARVGEQVTFEVTITNRGGTPATGLLVVDSYDDGFEHVSRANPIERNLSDLPAGASRSITVDLRVLQAGRLCNHVEVTSTGGPVARAEACLTAVGASGATVPGEEPQPAAPREAQISVKKTGPSLRPVGGVAEFTIVITNTGRVPVTNLKVADNYDRSLNPSQVTPGWGIAGTDLIWRIDRLEPGKSATLQIHCRCTQAVERSCNRVTVTTEEGARADDEACLEIRPPQGGLTMTVSDTRDPVVVGGDVTYEIIVRNTSQVVERQVTLSVALPAELTAVAAGTKGPTAHQVAGQSVNFQPVAEMQPGESLTFEVQARANQAGQARIRATLNSDARPQPLSEEETTAVFNQQ